MNWRPQHWRGDVDYQAADTVHGIYCIGRDGAYWSLALRTSYLLDPIAVDGPYLTQAMAKAAAMTDASRRDWYYVNDDGKSPRDLLRAAGYEIETLEDDPAIMLVTRRANLEARPVIPFNIEGEFTAQEALDKFVYVVPGGWGVPKPINPPVTPAPVQSDGWGVPKPVTNDGWTVPKG